MRNLSLRLMPDSDDIVHSFFHDAADALYVLDLEGQMIMANTAYTATYGWSEEEAMNEPFCFIPGDAIKEYEALWQRIRSGERVSGYKTTARRKDGSLFPVSLSCSPLRDKAGTIVGICTISKDTTAETKTIEELRENVAQYRLLIEATNDIIGIYDLQLKQKFISPSIQLHSGLSQEEYMSADVTSRIHPDDLARVTSTYQTLAVEKKTVQVEYRAQHKNGSWVYLEARAVPILNERQEVENILVVERNVTERKQNEEFLRKTEKLSVIGQLAAGIAHEIRNPLTSLKGFVQYLQPLLPEHKTFTDIMLSELERINLIVSEMLILAKPQSLQMKQRDVRDILSNVVTLLRSEANLQSIDIITQFDTTPLLVDCEENQLKQVFINILKNAMEAVIHGGKIVIQASKRDDQILIRFADNGCGIPSELIPKLGEPFYTTKDTGTGLGLMISNKIMKDHGGQIQITSQRNKGTTVDIALPIRS
ncbi:PAS domain S-box protein [Brevibacillus humidisoli]|uniref:PAS domain-containing sensor histidine kinase n=1 Tax=Brevibacillus humidisoli TaxID=2895522 RepID=UPI001E3E0337|nr:PAS domain-containing sensor histidine kinase [Brevibacillus humidisoli]UFJ41147.1 PAS domain S-box protein [Brevibacillus humidisoli]